MGVPQIVEADIEVDAGPGDGGAPVAGVEPARACVTWLMLVAVLLGGVAQRLTGMGLALSMVTGVPAR